MPREWRLQDIYKNGIPSHVRILRELYHIYLSSLYLLYAAVYTSYVVWRHKVNVILERGSSLGVGAYAGKLTRKPLVLEIIDPNYAHISVKTARMIFIYTKSVLREDVSDDKLIIITAGTDLELFRPDINGSEVRKKFKISKSAPVVGYVGVFAQWHGIEDLVEASKEVLKEAPNTKFLMVGPNYHNTQKIVEKAELDKAFIFVGPVSYGEVPKYISASDVIAAPYNPTRSPLMRKYDYYHSPIKVFEAMACGKPVVTTSIKIVKELIRDGEDGILVPHDNPQELAHAILRLLKDRKYAAMIGEGARKRVEGKFSWLAVARKIDDTLRSIVTGDAK